jgi:hypothetical protein
MENSSHSQVHQALRLSLPVSLPPLQPQRVTPRLRIPSNPLATRQVLIFDLLGLPLVVVVDLFLHVRGGFAGGHSDLAGNVAHGGTEDCFQAATNGVADGVEEAWSRMVSLFIC